MFARRRFSTGAVLIPRLLALVAVASVGGTLEAQENPFSNTLYSGPSLEESFYFTYSGNAPILEFMEFDPDAGGPLPKVGPNHMEAVLRDPGLIPTSYQLGRSVQLQDVDNPYDGPGNPAPWRPVRQYIEINGFTATLTYDPAAFNIKPHLVVIEVPGSFVGYHRSREGEPFADTWMNPVDRNGDDVVTGASRWAVVIGGVAIRFLVPKGGNQLMADVLAQLTMIRLAHSLFSYRDHPLATTVYPPAIALYGGSWGAQTAMTTTLSRPDLVDGCVLNAGILDAEAFWPFRELMQTRRMFYQGIGTRYSRLNGRRKLIHNFATMGAAGLPMTSLARWMSLSHRVPNLESEVHVFRGDDDFSSDGYGPQWEEIFTQLSDANKSHLYFDDNVEIHGGHGVATSTYTAAAFDKIRAFHRTRRDTNFGTIDPFAMEPLPPGSSIELATYREALHRRPVETYGGLFDPSADLQIEMGNAMSFPGRFETVKMINTDGLGDPEVFLCGSADGRLRLFELQRVGIRFDLVLRAETTSHGHGVAGLACLQRGASDYRVIVTSMAGNYREYDLTLMPSPSFSLALDATPSDTVSILGKNASIVHTQLPFLGGTGDLVFMHSSGRTLYQKGQALAPILIKDPTSGAIELTYTDPLPNAHEITWGDQSKDLFLLNSKGYIARVDPLQPLVGPLGNKQLQLSDISKYLAVCPDQLIDRTVGGGEFLIVSGVEGDADLVILPRHQLSTGVAKDLGIGTVSQLVEHPTDPSRFFVASGRSVHEYPLNSSGTDVSLCRSESLTDLSAPEFGGSGRIESLLVFTWGGVLSVLITEEYGGVLAALWPPTPQPAVVLYDSMREVRSKWQALAVEGDRVFAMNRLTGEAVELLPDLGLGTQIHPPFGYDIATYQCGRRSVQPKAIHVRVYDRDNDGTPEPVPFPAASRAARLRRLSGLPSTDYGDEVLHFDPVSDYSGSICSGRLKILPMEYPNSFLWESGVFYSGGNLNDLGSTKSIAYVELPSGTRYIVAASTAGWISIVSGTGPSDYAEVLDSNFDGRDTLGLDIKAGEESDESLVIYRAVRILNGQAGALQRWHLGLGGPPGLVMDWELLGGVDLDPGAAEEVLDCPIGVRYISEGSVDEGLLFVGDEAGHLWIFRSKDDRFVNPTNSWSTKFLSRSKALPGSVGASGFHYVYRDSDDRALYFSTGLATVRFDLDGQ